MSEKFDLISRSAAQTEKIGEALGSELQIGDVVALCGGLGAGKTALARGVGRGLGADGICSPTFTISMEYAGRVPFVHMDAYRLSGADEFFEMGLDEAFACAAVLIEWADIVRGALPGRRLELTLSQTGEDERVISVNALGGASSPALERMCSA